MTSYDLSIINVIMLFGTFQGLILAFILVTAKRLRKKSNIFFALLLFTFAVINLMGTLEDIALRDGLVTLKYFLYFPFSLIPFSLYFFIKYLINPNHKVQKLELLFLLPVFLELGYYLVRFVQYHNGHIYSSEEDEHFYFVYNIIETVAVLCTTVINIFAIYQLKEYEKKLYDNYSEVEDRSLNWLRKTIIGGLFVCFIWTITTIGDYDTSMYDVDSLSYFLWVALSFLIYWIGYSMIIRQELLDTPIFAISVNNIKQVSTSELSAKTDEHYQKILELLEVEKIFRDPNLNMSMLSELTGLSNGYLSQIINQKRRQNFFSFINEYRVNEVISNMTNPNLSHYSLMGLALESGFKSKSTFNSVFKKLTKKTPSEFKKTL